MKSLNGMEVSAALSELRRHQRFASSFLNARARVAFILGSVSFCWVAQRVNSLKNRVRSREFKGPEYFGIRL